MSFKARRAAFRRALRHWVFDLVDCTVHGEVKRVAYYPYCIFSPCSKCERKARIEDEAACEQRERERRIGEIAAAIRLSHPEIVRAIREAAGSEPKTPEVKE